MARAALLLTLVSVVYLCASAASTTSGGASTTFIRSSCATTTYPAVCVQSTVYASAIQKSPSQLAQTALSVSLAKAQSAKAFVGQCNKFKGLKTREYEAIKDCLDEMSDTVDRLTKSVAELKGMSRGKGQDFQFHVSNVQTWVSAALTDENTCFDGYSSKALDGRLKASIRARVLNVAQVTSNALALVNRYATN